jgi:hypothetical protein
MRKGETVKRYGLLRTINAAQALVIALDNLNERSRVHEPHYARELEELRTALHKLRYGEPCDA